VEFLASKNFEIPTFTWRNIQARQYPKLVRGISFEDYKGVCKTLNKPHLSWAVRLARWLALRVSEVCRLRVGDFIFGDFPYLNIRPSKNDKARRVDLSHLNSKRIKALEKFVQERKKDGLHAYLLLNDTNFPHDPKRVSSKIGLIMDELGLRDPELKGKFITFHGFRASGCEDRLTQNHDPRYAAHQLGHSFMQVTFEHYLHSIDLRASVALLNIQDEWFQADFHLPVVLVASLMGRTSNTIRNTMQDYNLEHPNQMIEITSQDELVEPRPPHTGAAMGFIHLQDANRLLKWKVCGR
jgi:integrase